MWQRFTSHLYLRIWLAVVATVVLLTFLATAVWRLSSSSSSPLLPQRSIELRNAQGDLMGQGQSQTEQYRGDDIEFTITLQDGQQLQVLMPTDQRILDTYMPRSPYGFIWMMGVVSLAVALGAYPIIRRLTKRLEALQRGVERWGMGDLSARVQTDGCDEIAYLAARFNHAAERIETLMASHKSLLANASHELRSPLARIRMGLELLAPGETDFSATLAQAVLPAQVAQRQQTKREISRSIIELDQLIDEILLVSRLGSAPASHAEPFETVDLSGLAAEECARLQAELILPHQNTAYGSSENENDDHALVVQGSARLLRRMIRNLLENARRHGSGTITLELERSPKVPGRPSTALIRVNDCGPGVPPTQRERIFEPFYRLPGASEKDGGVGLGLALVKTISQRHGGSVRCEAAPGGGASFVVELPTSADNRWSPQV